MTAQTRSEIAALLERHGLRPIHRLGQHFLADANITRKIVDLADVGAGDLVVEVGAGTGTLTAALATTGAHVVSYEVDERLRPILEDVVEGLDVELKFADVTNAHLAVELEGGPWTMVANLPYNVGTPLVMDVLRHVESIERFVVMVQKEVGDRFAALPGTADYGLPSVVAGIHSTAKVMFRVPAQVFYPAPKVDSAVVMLERKSAPESSEAAIELARAGFGQRRKMLRKSLAGLLDNPERVLKEAGLDPTCRAETVSPEEFLKLAEVAS